MYHNSKITCILVHQKERSYKGFDPRCHYSCHQPSNCRASSKLRSAAGKSLDLAASVWPDHFSSRAFRPQLKFETNAGAGETGNSPLQTLHFLWSSVEEGRNEVLKPPVELMWYKQVSITASI